MTKDTENANPSPETAGQIQSEKDKTQKPEPWWRKDPAGKESSFDHPNMNPDNLKSNDQ